MPINDKIYENKLQTSLESKIEHDTSKINNLLSGTEVEIYYGEDRWIFQKGYEVYNFDDVNYIYKDYVKDYVYKLRVRGYAISTRLKYYNIMKNIITFLIKNNIRDGISIYKNTIDEFNKFQFIERQNVSEGTKTHYRRIFKELLEVIEIKHNQDYEELKEMLSKNETRLLKVQGEKGKTPNIPQDILYKIIDTAIIEIENDNMSDKEKIEACCTLLLSQTGLRIGELALLECDKLHMYHMSDDITAGYIDMWALKEEKYTNKTKSVCFMTDKSILAYKTLEKLTHDARLRDRRDSFFEEPEKKYTTTKLREGIYDFCIRNFEKIGLLNNKSDGFKRETFLSENKTTQKIKESHYRKFNGILPPRGTFFIGIPKPHQYRVAVCNELIRQGVDLSWVMQHMNHLTPEMTDYYIRNEKDEIKVREDVITDVVTGSYRLIGEDAEDLMERIHEFIDENEFNIQDDLNEIVTQLKGKIPIREKKEGFCIKSSFGRACKRNEFSCAFDSCNNFCTSYLFTDITYKRFKNMKMMIEYNRNNGFIKEAEMEEYKMKKMVLSRLSKEIKESEYEMKRQGVEKIIESHPDLEYIVNNIDNIKEEIGLWM